MTNNYRERITELILNGDHYPNTVEVIESCSDMDGYEFVLFFTEMLAMQDEGEILFDHKHEVWIWTGWWNTRMFIGDNS